MVVVCYPFLNPVCGRHVTMRAMPPNNRNMLSHMCTPLALAFYGGRGDVHLWGGGGVARECLGMGFLGTSSGRILGCSFRWVTI